MISGLNFMLAPFAASLLLIIITVYFGIHVIEREIIFIDIALAQIAALGSAVSLVINQLHGNTHAGHDSHDSRTLLAYLFCLVAAGVYSSEEQKDKNTYGSDYRDCICCRYNQHGYYT